MLNMIKKLVIEEEGQGMTEYALVLGVIALGAVGAMVVVKGNITTLWEDIKTQMSTAVTAL